MRSSALLWASVMCVCLVTGCKPKPAAAPPQEPAPAAAAPAITELQREDLTVGVGEALADGQVAIVHFTGWLYDPSKPDRKGTKYDTSRDSPQPDQITVGAGQVVKGWDLGIVGMQVGGLRRLVIPPDLAYGAAGAPGAVPIPPNSPLVVEVELLGIEPSSAPPQ